MKKTICSSLFLLLLSLNISVAQDEVKIYSTYEEYLVEKPSAVYQGFFEFIPNYNLKRSSKYLYDPILRVRDDENKKQGIYIKDEWGFVYKGILFRNTDDRDHYIGKKLYSDNIYMALTDTIAPGLYFWENAAEALLPYVEVFMGRYYGRDYSYGQNAYYSLEIDGDFYTGSSYVELKEKFPILEKISQCYYHNIDSRILKAIYRNKKTGKINYDGFYANIFLKQAVATKKNKGFSINRDCIKEAKSTQ